MQNDKNNIIVNLVDKKVYIGNLCVDSSTKSSSTEKQTFMCFLSLDRCYEMKMISWGASSNMVGLESSTIQTDSHFTVARPRRFKRRGVAFKAFNFTD